MNTNYCETIIESETNSYLINLCRRLLIRDIELLLFTRNLMNFMNNVEVYSRPLDDVASVIFTTEILNEAYSDDSKVKKLQDFALEIFCEFTFRQYSELDNTNQIQKFVDHFIYSIYQTRQSSTNNGKAVLFYKTMARKYPSLIICLEMELEEIKREKNVES